MGLKVTWTSPDPSSYYGPVEDVNYAITYVTSRGGGEQTVNVSAMADTMEGETLVSQATVYCLAL